jgi:hypothetical protein
MSLGNPGANGNFAYIYTNKDWGISRNNLDGDLDSVSQDWVLYHGTVFFVSWLWTDEVGEYLPGVMYVPMQGMQDPYWSIISVEAWGAPETSAVWELLQNNCDRVTDYNCSNYGMCKNRGSYYSLRSECDYVDSNGNQTGIHLCAGADRPVFGYGHAVDNIDYISISNFNGWSHLSTDGWIDGKGLYHGCSGLNASLYLFTHPSNYIINTY